MSKVTLNDYMFFTRETAIYPSEQAVEYCSLGLANEVGEVLGKIKKGIRDGHEDVDGIGKELGDVLWYWVRLCDEYGFDPDDILQENITKLLSRKERGKLGGSGDDR